MGRTRFECWELGTRDGDERYLDGVSRHWEHLKEVVAEDVDIFCEWAPRAQSSAYTRNVLNDHECKITFFHRRFRRCSMPDPATLEPADILAIHQLLALYGHLLDDGEYDRLDEVFTDDAELNSRAGTANRCTPSETSHDSSPQQTGLRHTTPPTSC